MEERRTSKRQTGSALARPNGRKAKGTRKKRASNVAVDLAKLQMSSLKRYRNLFKLEVPVDATKGELIDAVRRHWVNGYPRLRAGEVMCKFLEKNEIAKKRELQDKR